MPLSQQDKDKLELLIANHGTKDLLKAMSEICQDISDHINENWQDRALARLWLHDSNRILKCSNAVTAS